MRKSKNSLSVSAAVLAAVYFLCIAQSAFAGSIVGWGSQVVSGDLSGGFVKVAAGAAHSVQYPFAQ